MTRLRLAVLLCALALLAVGCGWLDRDDATPEPSPTAIPTSTAPTPSPTATPTETEPPLPPAPALATVEPGHIAGLETVSDSRLGDPYRYFATHPLMPAFPLLEETLNAAIDRERSAFEAERGPFDPVPPEAAGPSFNASFDLLVASGDVLGVRLHFYEFFGANGIDRSAVFWFDLSSGDVLPATALFEPNEGLTAVLAELRDAILEGYRQLIFPEDLEAVLANPEERLRTIGFSPAGDLVVIFDEYAIGPGALGQIAIELPAASVVPHLSDFGRRVREETLSPSGPIRLPPLPTPTPAPPTPTPPPPTPTVPPVTSTPVVTPPPPTEGVDCAVTACVALTFDDGPARYTATLLDTLAAAQAPATFFVVGVNAQVQGALLARMVNEGHEIGNHSYDHRDLTTLSDDAIRNQIASTTQIVAAATGVTPTLVRPPYGATNERVRTALDAPFILWSVDPRDWADRNTAVVTQRVLADTRAGGIVLLHDIHATTVAAVPAIIEGLRARGFTLVTVSTLLDGALAPGRTYSHR